jgi:nitrous oxide reductase accessory protein NosL
VSRFILAVSVSAALCGAACGGSSTDSPATAPAAVPVDPKTVGTVTGRVVLAGTPPSAEVIHLDSDPNCTKLAQGEERRTEYFVMGPDNTLQNVFVYVKEGVAPSLYPIPREPVILDQQKCRYIPRVLGLQVGQELTIRNSDPLMHNVQASSNINEPFNLGQPIQGIESKRTFTTREVMVPFKCNVHNWMHAYIGVVEHPFFGVSDGSGRFSIAKLPPGSYTIEAWHERLGTSTQQVTVAAQETREITFTFKAS